jgi:AcrR family transcriptional regulator
MADERSMTIKRRAIKDEQKQERRRAILDIAWLLFQSTPYQQIAVSEVAERAGLAKGTVYLYFKTKEELFLALQEQQLVAWFDEVDARLRALQGAGEIARVAELICGSLERRPGLTRLLAMLHNILEQNVDYDTTLRFKRLLLARMNATGALLEGCLPFLAPGQGAHLLLQAHALIIGLRHLADPAPVARQVLAEPEMAPFVIAFGLEFLKAFAALLLGLEHMADRRDAV